MSASSTPAGLRSITSRQFSSLSIYNYRVYFLGQLISLVGTWMQTTAQAYLVLKLTGSPLALGTVTTLQFLPITIFTLFGGALADRFPKRQALIALQFASMIQAFVLGLLVLTDTVELWHVYALAFWLGLVNAFDGPVRQSFVVELVGREHLVNAVALNSSIFNMARVAGPAVAGVTIATIGMSTAFLANAASYIAVLAAYAVMRPSEFVAVPRKPANGNVFAQVVEGLSYARRTPQVLFFFILLAFIGTFGYNFTILIPLVAEFVLEVGASKFGLLTSALGFGSLLAALAMAGLGKLSLRRLVLATGAFILLFVAIGISTSYWVTFGLFVVLGTVGVLFSTTINTTLQMIVPDELRGRVMSIFFLLFAGTTPIGGYLTGAMAEEWGVRTTLFVLSGICAAGLGTALAYRQACRLPWTDPVVEAEQVPPAIEPTGTEAAPPATAAGG